MKLEKEVKILPIVLSDTGGKDIYKNVTIYINISELTNEEMKIIRKGQLSKLKLTLEMPEPILDEAERKYLSGVIRPFRDKVENIVKTEWLASKNESINILMKNGFIVELPPFKEDTIYKSMKLNKKYTLEDLGL